MFSVVAMKSRAFSSVPCSAPEQACRSCEGAQPGSQPRLAEGNVLYHGCQAQFMNGGCGGERGGRGRKLSFHSRFHEFESSLVWEFKHFWEFSLFWQFCKSTSLEFCDCCSGTDY